MKNNIKQERYDIKSNGKIITQEELAKNTGVTRQTIHAVEKGKFEPSGSLMMKIARAFKKSVEQMFELEKND